jgi:hypothetical protein
MKTCLFPNVALASPDAASALNRAGTKSVKNKKKKKKQKGYRREQDSNLRGRTQLISITLEYSSQPP